MKVNFVTVGKDASNARKILQIDNAHIIYRNFEGRGGKYNRPGERNFAVVIPTTELADILTDNGWNIKVKPNKRDDQDVPFMYLPVKVSVNDRGPAIYVACNDRQDRILPPDFPMLDRIDIVEANMDIRPYDWEVDGRRGRTAYLQSMQIIQRVDRFAGDGQPYGYTEPDAE